MWHLSIDDKSSIRKQDSTGIPWVLMNSRTQDRAVAYSHLTETGGTMLRCCNLGTDSDDVPDERFNVAAVGDRRRVTRKTEIAIFRDVS